MAKVTLVGVQRYDFPADDGKQIKGYSLQLNYPDENVFSLKADHKFISDSLCTNLGITHDDLLALVHGDIEIELNLKGKIQGIKSV